MDSLTRRATLCLTLALLFTPASGAWSADKNKERPADYMPSIRQELARLDLQARCDDTTASCVYAETIDDKGTRLEVVLRYSRKTDTVYVSMERFLVLGEAAGPPLPLALRLLELNREMVAGKFEWDRPTSAIRLSMVLNTDSNFDRRAFRSLLVGLSGLAKRLWPELNQLAQLSPPAAAPDTEPKQEE